MLGSIQFFAGLLIGLALGFSLGISIGKKQKPWSDLTPEEKRLRTVLIIVGVVLVILGIIGFFVARSSAV